MKGQYAEATRQIEGLSNEKESLSQKVAIAAQLDATGITRTAKKKNGKPAKKIKDCKSFQVDFTVARNVTASNGLRTFYVRITTPNGTTLGGGGSFQYENRTLECTMKKAVEYSGEAITLSTYRQVTEYLEAGTYTVSIFADGNMIGSRTFAFN